MVEIKEQNQEEETDAFENLEAFYLYQPEKRKCYLAWIIPDTQEIALKFELKKANENSYQDVFEYWWEDKKCLLTLERNGDRLEAYLTEVKTKLPTVFSIEYADNWNEIDWGKMVWNEEHQDYLSVKGLPKSFFCLINDYQDQEEVRFNFLFEAHLVLKDKDPQKNYIWYQFDYNWELSNFLYDLLHPDIKPKQGEIVAIPAEYSQTLEPWVNNSYEVNGNYHATEWPERVFSSENDLSHYTWEKWKEHNSSPALIISFLPTFSGNYQLEEKDKLTGTRWFRHLYSVFIQNDIPVVLKCYPDFLRQMALKHADWYQHLSNKVELPSQISGKALGSGNVLALFNCSWLKNKKISFIKWYDAFLNQEPSETYEDNYLNKRIKIFE